MGYLRDHGVRNRGTFMIRTSIMGGRSRRYREPPKGGRAQLVSSQLAHLSRLERELERACARYERAIAALDEDATEFERRARAKRLVDEAMEDSPPEQQQGEPERQLSLSDASFEDLRTLGLSVTQARRVVELRDEGVLGGTAGLNEVPGIPEGQLIELKQHLRD
jgi:hypothetical protein